MWGRWAHKSNYCNSLQWLACGSALRLLPLESWKHPQFVSIRCMYTPWTDKNLVWRDGIAVIILFLLLCFVHVRKKWEETVYASGLSTVLEMDWENITLKSHHSWELRLPYRLSRRGFSILCLIFLTVKKIKSCGLFCTLIQCSSD